MDLPDCGPRPGPVFRALRSRPTFGPATSRGQGMEPPRPASRLYVVTPRLDDAAAMAMALGAALDAADVAALLLDGRAELVARAGADGAHLSGIDPFKEALPALKPARIAGVGGLVSRD